MFGFNTETPLSAATKKSFSVIKNIIEFYTLCRKYYSKRRYINMAVAHKSVISFGLVAIPVSMYTTIQDNDIHFNQLHNEDNETENSNTFE